jgi:hypothetical protein
MTVQQSLSDAREVSRLTLQIERDILAETHHRKHMMAAARAQADHRYELLTVKARIGRTRALRRPTKKR